ncbi:MAG: PQQ-binding-like beta-propeller repeat protein [Candidatus Bathyarchaeia archaeon]
MRSRMVAGMLLAVLFTIMLPSVFAETSGTAWRSSDVQYAGSRGVVQMETSGLYGFPDLAPTGRSFGVSTKIGGTYEGGYPMVATDGAGGVYVTWYNLDTLELFFTYSHDYGRSWGPVTKICGGGNPLVGCSDPDVAVDSQNGYVYVEWIDNRTGHTNVQLCRSVDRGVSFGSAATINNVGGSDIVRVDNGVSYTTHVAVANDGTVYVAWEDNRTSPSCSDVYLAKSTDDGETFNTNTRVNPYEANTNHTVPWITVDQAGVVYVAYTKTNTTIQSIYLTKSLDGGLSFRAAVEINDDSGYYYRGKKEVAVSKDGKVHVVWTDGRNQNGYWDIYFAMSLDGGLSFGPNVRVNDDHTANWHGTPSLAIDSDGGIHIVWEDFRNNGVTSTYFRDAYYAYSEDGIHFSENVKVNYVPNATWVDCADPNLAVDSYDNLYIVWADSPYSKINYTVYFAFSAGSTSPMFQHDQTHSGYSTSVAPDTNQTLWNFTTDGPLYSSPAVADGTVYACPEGAKVYAIDAFTGTLIWNYTTTGNLVGSSSPAVVDGKVYVGSWLGIVYALNATTGTQVWNFTTGGDVESSPAVVYGKVYVGSSDGEVYALNASLGTLMWNCTTAGAVYSSPAAAEGRIYVGSNDDRIYALNASTGALIWNYTTGGMVRSSPTVADGVVFTGSYDGKVYGLNASTGALIWSYQTGLWVWSSPAVVNDIVYVGSMDGKLYALNASTGTVIWNYTTGGPVGSSPAVADGKLFVGSDNDRVYALNATTGTLVWSYLTSYGVRSSPAVADGKVFIGSNNGQVYVFGPGPGVPEFPAGLMIPVFAALSFIAVVATKLSSHKKVLRPRSCRSED